MKPWRSSSRAGASRGGALGDPAMPVGVFRLCLAGRHVIETRLDTCRFCDGLSDRVVRRDGEGGGPSGAEAPPPPPVRASAPRPVPVIRPTPSQAPHPGPKDTVMDRAVIPSSGPKTMMDAPPVPVSGEVVGWFRALSGADRGRSWSLVEGRHIIGGSPDSLVAMRGEGVPSRAAVLYIQGGRFQLEAGRSVSPSISLVQVNGRNVDRVELQDGDEVVVGAARLRFKCLSTEDLTPLPDPLSSPGGLGRRR